MSKILLPALFAVLVLSAAPARALEATGSVTATSDYVFRGVSQTLEEPALQIGVKLAGESGLYGALWASNVDYGNAIGSDAEVDYTLGWGGNLSEDWALDVNGTYYTYPGTRAGIDLDYAELIGTVTWRQRWFGVVGYSHDVFASGEAGTWLQFGGRFALAEDWVLEASVAHYALDDALSDSYQVAALGVTWTHDAFSVRGTGHLTSDSAEDLFGSVGKPRFELAAAWSF